MIINAEDFKEYLNDENIVIDEQTTILVEKDFLDKTKSSILITNKPDYREQINIEFTMRFAHHKYQEEKIFQRDFAIEHHPPDKSRHNKPHLQIKIHGPENEDKVGKLWLTLILREDDDDKEYEKCIKGFMYALDEIADICKDGLDEELLNTEKIEELKPEKEFLMNKIKESLETKGIEFQSPEGETYFVTGEKTSKLIAQDKTLKPLLTFK